MAETLQRCNQDITNAQNEGFQGQVELVPTQKSETVRNTVQRATEFAELLSSAQQSERMMQRPVMYDRFDIIASERMAGGE